MNNIIDRIANDLTPYTPGEQEIEEGFIKLNTNENPYPTSDKIKNVLNNFDILELCRYPDPDYKNLRKIISDIYNIDDDKIFIGSGSDEVLLYTFKAFSNLSENVYYPDITYDFYKLYSELYKLNEIEVPLDKNFKIDINDYKNLDGNIIIANPNAPIGNSISLEDIEEIINSNKDNLVVIDEAYIDFSKRESAIKLIDKYENLLVIQTSSKSRSLAGLRLGFGFGNIRLIERLNRIKFATNPYNLSSIDIKIAEETIKDVDYFKYTTKKIMDTRDRVTKELRDMGFEVFDSEGNFVFARHNSIGGEELFKSLNKKKIHVRYFPKERVKDYIRISIGTDEEMDIFLDKTKLILGEIV